MKLLGFLNLRGISGQIAALVVVSIVAIHLILTAIFLIHRPDQPIRRSTAARPACRCGPAARRHPRGRPDAAVRRHRAGVSASRHRKPALGSVPRQLNRRARTCAACIAASAAATGSFRSGQGEDAHKVGIVLPDGAMVSAKMLPGLRQRPFWCGTWMMTLLFAVVSVTLLGPVGGAGADRAVVVVCQGRRKLQPERRRRTVAGTRPGGNPLGGEGAQPHARAHHRP